MMKPLKSNARDIRKRNTGTRRNKTKKQKQSAKNSIRVALILCFVLINSVLVVQFIEQSYILPQQQADIEEKQQIIDSLNDRRSEVERLIEAGGSRAAIERAAREKLGLVKPDEVKLEYG